MWPDPGEALSRTIEAESAIADLYAEALRRWAPDARAAVLPALTAAVLPPDPAAVAQTQTAWDEHAGEVIVAGLGIIWAVAVYETAVELGGTVADAVVPDVDTVVLGIVLASLIGLSRKQVVDAVGYVESTPALTVARDEYLAGKRDSIAATPSIVRSKVEAAIAEPALTVSIVPEDRLEVMRARADEVMQPASPEMRDVAKQQGYQAAGVMNHAVLAAAQASAAESGEELQKTWICTLDGKTRPSHWAGDGQRVALSAAFTIGGEQLQFPGDTSASPAEWKNCRCRMGILAADEELPDEVDRHTERLNGRDSVAINRNGRTQAEEIERRRRAGNIRARESSDGTGRVASVTEETDMTELVIGEPTEAELSTFEQQTDPDFAGAITALTAASATAEPRLRTYDPRLFEDPKLTRPTAPTMNNETGRIYGHIAEWGHTIRGGRDVTPRNRNGYLNFHTGQVQLDNGRQLSVGRLTVQGGHASTERGVTAAAARAHYDDVTTAFGLVRVGEDRFGIWFSGVPYPGVDPDVFQQGMTTQLSGDWRDCPGAPLDMIAAHAVNTQGFPIYSALTGPDGREMALVASLGPVRRPGAAQVVLVEDVRAIVAEEMAESQRKAALAARLDTALTAAHAAVGDPPEPPTITERVDEMLARAELVAAPAEGH